MSSLRTLDFTPSAIDSIWAMTAAILHLGNVDFFLDENDTAGIRNMDVVDKVLRSLMTLLDLVNIFNFYLQISGLLGVSANELSEALLTRVIAAAGQVMRKPHGVTEAAVSLDSFAKALYDRLFTWYALICPT